MAPTEGHTVASELDGNLPGIPDRWLFSLQEVMAPAHGEKDKEVFVAEILELGLAGEMKASPLPPFRDGDVVLPEKFFIDRPRILRPKSLVAFHCTPLRCTWVHVRVCGTSCLQALVPSLPTHLPRLGVT